MSVLFIGSYTKMLAPDFGGHGKGIYSLLLNDETGELKLLHTESTINPAYLCLSSDRKYLYTIKEVLEEERPVVKGYKIDENYTLHFINEQPIPGSLPCHIVWHNNAVLVSCYGTGNILRYPATKNGNVLAYTDSFIHEGSSINPARQEDPHAHQVAIHPDGTHAYVPDLGIDMIKAYQIEDNTMKPKNEFDIRIPEGSGPRHIVFNKNGSIGYVINELTGDISIIQRQNGYFSFLKNMKSLPSSFKETPSASAIRVHPKGRFLYAANRTLDAITIFKIKEDDLELVMYQVTNGKTLREFNISPDGNWLIACLQDSDEIVVYKIEIDGKLSEKCRTTEIASPVCVQFL